MKMGTSYFCDDHLEVFYYLIMRRLKKITGGVDICCAVSVIYYNFIFGSFILNFTRNLLGDTGKCLTIDGV